MRGLGPLEAVVMQQLWSSEGPQTVRSVHERIAADREIAYTTVMTVMDNLYRKGMLNRERQGRAYLYSATRSQEEYTATLLEDVLAQSGNRSGVLMHFVEQLDADEVEALRRVVTQAGGEHPAMQNDVADERDAT